MTARRLLVVPFLSPLLAVLLVAALNPRPQLSFRVLTWTTPSAPLGLWLGGAALGGAALSGAGAALALGQGAGAWATGRRRVTTPRSSRTSTANGSRGDGRWEDLADGRPGRVEGWQQPWEGRHSQDDQGRGWAEDRPVAVAPTRAPGDPAPTMDAPFRILRRPPAPQGEKAPTSTATGSTSSLREREPVAVALDDGWGRDSSGEEW